jgi:5-methylcytosine-specific restriction endonuclease McrA
MKRAFCRLQKRVLAWRAGGKCEICGAALVKEFHADHVVPFSRGGATTTNNGQALCATCNLKKGTK